MRIAFTGHRPKDLGGFTNAQFIGAYYAWMLSQDKNDPITEAHVGGALGVDQWAMACISDHPAINTTVHMPFTLDVMGRFWTPNQRAHFDYIHKTAAKCGSCPGDMFDMARYQRRNIHMVDNCDVLLAVWSGKTYGGTYNAIRYARAIKKPMFNLMTMDTIR